MGMDSAQAPSQRADAVAVAGPTVSPSTTTVRLNEVRLRTDRLIQAIDDVLSAQVDAIIHHPRFQRLEARWRQLERLVRVPRGTEIVVRVFPASWRELARDAARAAEFDQTRLFDLIYSQEFDMPGGQPFGMLVGDYDVTAGIHPDHRTDDIEVLEAVASVAAAAFAPFICSAAPPLLDVERFAELDRELDMAYLRDLDTNVRWDRLRRLPDSRFVGITAPRVLVRGSYRSGDPRRVDGFRYRERTAPDGSTLLWGSAAPPLLDVEQFAELDRELDMAYLRDLDTNVRWDRLRRLPDSRFVGITAPRVLVRGPYRSGDPRRVDGFRYRERTAPDGSTLLWGSAAFAFAETVLREFMATGWFADIRGVRSVDRGGGIVADRPAIRFETDRDGSAVQAPVEIRFTPAQEQMLASFGIIPLMPLPWSADAVFNTNQSLHVPPRYDSEAANQNARIAAMLQYVLCACRFAHYLKLIMRENVGQVATADSLRDMLNTWLAEYTIGNDDADALTKARFPLRSANVALREVPGQPGVFNCVVQLQPHFQLDDVSASFQLLADMSGRGRQSPEGS